LLIERPDFYFAYTNLVKLTVVVSSNLKILAKPFEAFEHSLKNM